MSKDRPRGEVPNPTKAARAAKRALIDDAKTVAELKAAIIQVLEL
jgi:hypothetical protein